MDIQEHCVAHWTDTTITKMQIQYANTITKVTSMDQRSNLATDIWQPWSHDKDEVKNYNLHAVLVLYSVQCTSTD